MIKFIEHISEPSFYFNVQLLESIRQSIVFELDSNKLKSPLMFKWYASIKNLDTDNMRGNRMIISKSELDNSLALFNNQDFPEFNLFLNNLKNSIDIEKED